MTFHSSKKKSIRKKNMTERNSNGETEDQKIERKIREYEMAKSRTKCAKSNLTCARFALGLAALGVVIGVFTLLKVYGTLR